MQVFDLYVFKEKTFYSTFTKRPKREKIEFQLPIQNSNFLFYEIR